MKCDVDICKNLHAMSCCLSARQFSKRLLSARRRNRRCWLHPRRDQCGYSVSSLPSALLTSQGECSPTTSPYSVYELAPVCREQKHKYRALWASVLFPCRVHTLRGWRVLIHEGLRVHTPQRLWVHTHEGSRVHTLDGFKTCFAGSRIQRPALQAAGYTCSPWRTQERDHGFDRVFFLCWWLFQVQEYSELQVMEQIHEQIVDIPGFGEPALFQCCWGGFCATGRCFTSSLWRVYCACIQPSPSGTDRCRGHAPEHFWKLSCVCRTQCPMKITLCLTPFFVWFGWTWSYWVYDEILTERGTLSLPPQSVSLRHFATCVWLRYRAQIDHVRKTLPHCFRLWHSATRTNCFFCTTGRWIFSLPQKSLMRLCTTRHCHCTTVYFKTKRRCRCVYSSEILQNQGAWQAGRVFWWAAYAVHGVSCWVRKLQGPNSRGSLLEMLQNGGRWCPLVCWPRLTPFGWAWSCKIRRWSHWAEVLFFLPPWRGRSQ